jgi:hypothetical protein
MSKDIRKELIMNKFIAPILTGLLLAGGSFAAAKRVPGKDRIFCPQVVGGKCSEHQKKQIPRCKDGRGKLTPCRPHGPF